MTTNRNLNKKLSKNTGKKQSKLKPSNKGTHKSAVENLAEIPKTKATRTDHLARFLFTTKTSRWAFLILLILLLVLCGAAYLFFHLLLVYSGDYQMLVQKNDLANRLKKKGLTITANCTYESDLDKDFFQKFEKWNLKLCRTSCGSTAYAFRIDRSLVNNTDCVDRVDMVPCHLAEDPVCLPVNQEQVKKHLRACPGKNKVPLPYSQVSVNNIVTFHVGLFQDENMTYAYNNPLILQTQLLAKYQGKQLLGQSIIVICPKCTVSSRCYPFDIIGNDNFPPSSKCKDCKDSAFREMTTLRLGYPIYAETCDILEKLDIEDSKQACPLFE